MMAPEAAPFSLPSFRVPEIAGIANRGPGRIVRLAYSDRPQGMNSNLSRFDCPGVVLLSQRNTARDRHSASINSVLAAKKDRSRGPPLKDNLRPTTYFISLGNHDYA
jgi:hypothetical protein